MCNRTTAKGCGWCSGSFSLFLYDLHLSKLSVAAIYNLADAQRNTPEKSERESHLLGFSYGYLKVHVLLSMWCITLCRRMHNSVLRERRYSAEYSPRLVRVWEYSVEYCCGSEWCYGGVWCKVVRFSCSLSRADRFCFFRFMLVDGVNYGAWGSIGVRSPLRSHFWRLHFMVNSNVRWNTSKNRISPN